MPELSPQERALAALSRATQFSDKLFEALEDLEEAGGIEQVLSLQKPKSAERTLTILTSARDALNGQLTKLNALKKRLAQRPRPQGPGVPPGPGPAPGPPDSP